ncbi:MAG: hypothetical protein RI952_1139 [Bacteroidota bacterium]|jgi:hypothetical protein
MLKMKHKMPFYSIILSCFLILLSNVTQAQSVKNDTIMVRGVIIDGDTIPYQYISVVNIYAERMFKNRREYAKYTKLRRDVLKVWPYAKLTEKKFNELAVQLGMTKDERVKKALVNKTEKEIKDRFEGELKNLTITQGRILIKLIDRQTGNTSYAVLQELKGNLSAFFWQSLARLFGNNLKAHYDPNGEDAEIEKIVKTIE